MLYRRLSGSLNLGDTHATTPHVPHPLPSGDIYTSGYDRAALVADMARQAREWCWELPKDFIVQRMDERSRWRIDAVVVVDEKEERVVEIGEVAVELAAEAAGGAVVPGSARTGEPGSGEDSPSPLTVMLDCGCAVRAGWRCPVHGAP